jgi:hypothetical protein
VAIDIRTSLRQCAPLLAVAMLAAGCVAADTEATPAYVWSEAAHHAAFIGRDAFGALVFKEKVWMLGGWTSIRNVPNFPETGYPGCCTTNEVWNSSDGIHWTFVGLAPWERRHMTGWVVFNDMMWVIGGDDNMGHYQYDIWNTTDGEHWNEVIGYAPWSPRVLHYVLAFDNALWVIGGQQLPAALVPRPDPYPADPVDYADVWRSRDGVRWARVGVVPHHIGIICGTVVFDNQMWVIGGGTYGDHRQQVPSVPYNEVWSSSDGITWTQHPNAPWSPRRYHDVAVFDSRIWVLAGDGYDGEPFKNDVWYSTDGVQWIQLPDTPWIERHAASVFVLNDALFMMGGTPIGQGSLNDIWKLQVVE